VPRGAWPVTGRCGLALAALACLADGEARAAGEALAQLLDAHGLAREKDVVWAWLSDSDPAAGTRHV